MLAMTEMMVSGLVNISKLMDAAQATMGQAARAKGQYSLMTREVV